MFFLTQMDPRAAIKGSRDPLGFQPIWTHFGRHIVGNLTTVTTSVKNFATLLLGYYFADKAFAAGAFGEQRRANIFLKFEQLAAYSRYAYNEDEADADESPLGIRRVRRRFHEEHGRLRISALQEHQILSNQKTYGLWGLYTVAARQSGLIERTDNCLSQSALTFVESHYLPHLSYSGSKDGAEVIRFLLKDSWFEPKKKDRRLGKALAEILGPKLTRAERDYYMQTLVLGVEDGCNHTGGRQQDLWETIKELNDAGHIRWNGDFDFYELTEVVKRAQANGAGPLASSLEPIRIIEPILAASSRLFGFLLKRNEAGLEETAQEVRVKWGRALKHIEAARVEYLQSRIEEASIAAGSAERIVRLAGSLRAGNYADVIRTAADQNAEVMKTRGGAPWLAIERGRLKVRLREESGFLPEADELPALWVNSYFINSLKAIGRKLAGRRG
jgi:hypothetical protein